MNSTAENCTVADEFKHGLYRLSFSFVFILGLFFNMVALYIFTCTLKQRNETITFMLNLAVCDTLFVISLPFRIFYYFNGSWPFGDMFCKISVITFYMNMYGGILFLTCISADRFLAIVYPFASMSLRTPRNTKITCALVWLVMLSVSLSAGIQLNSSSVNQKTTCFENFERKVWKSQLSHVTIVMVTLGFVIPLLINVFCSVSILRILRKPDTIRNGALNKTKIVRMIIVHLFIFCFCFIPYNVNLIFYTLIRSESIKSCAVEKVVKTINPIALCIAVTNCCFDPVVYYFTSETIQKSIKRRNALSIKDYYTVDKKYTKNISPHVL